MFPLNMMIEGLCKILGYSLYSELNIDTAVDKKSVISALKQHIKISQNELGKAERKYEKALKQARFENKKSYLAIDAKIKQTLRSIKSLGLDLWSLDAILREVRGGQLLIDLGVPIDPKKIDLPEQNF